MASESLQTYAQFRPTSYDAPGLNGAYMGNGEDADTDRRAWLVCPVTQTRDSGPMARSNFRSFLRKLGGEGDHVEVHRFGHWGPGWFEIIIVRPETEQAETAGELADALADYPIVDESDYSELEYETAAEYWEHCSIAERVDWCRRFHVSIFAARRPEVPEDPSGELLSRLAE